MKNKNRKEEKQGKRSTKTNIGLNKVMLGLLMVGLSGGYGCAYDPPNDEEQNPQKASENPPEPDQQSAEGSENANTESNTPAEQIPDLILVGNTVVTSSPPKSRRLVLSKNVQLFTHGGDVTFEADEIVAEEGATINTLPDPPTAAEGQTGSSGGSVTVVADRAFGTLHIGSLGQGGGAGVRGETGKDGQRGDRGSDGVDVRLPPTGMLFCGKKTGDGFAGSRGGMGGRGGTGAIGGDSAAILVEVAHPDNFRVTYEVRPGKGGASGQGGPGGAGGSGGLPGNPSRTCRPAKSGGKGLQGVDGPLGRTGADGTAQPVCLKMGGSEIGVCAPHSVPSVEGANERI